MQVWPIAHKVATYFKFACFISVETTEQEGGPSSRVISETLSWVNMQKPSAPDPRDGDEKGWVKKWAEPWWNQQVASIACLWVGFKSLLKICLTSSNIALSVLYFLYSVKYTVPVSWHLLCGVYICKKMSRRWNRFRMRFSRLEFSHELRDAA